MRNCQRFYVIFSQGKSLMQFVIKFVLLPLKCPRSTYVQWFQFSSPSASSTCLIIACCIIYSHILVFVKNFKNWMLYFIENKIKLISEWLLLLSFTQHLNLCLNLCILLLTYTNWWSYRACSSWLKILLWHLLENKLRIWSDLVLLLSFPVGQINTSTSNLEL